MLRQYSNSDVMLKKSFSCFKLVLVVSFCMAILSGCGSTNDAKDNSALPKRDKNGNNNQPILIHNENDDLNAETVWQIRQDFYNYEINRVGNTYPGITLDSVFIRDYHGTYNNSVVVKMSRTPPAPVLLPELIVGETLLPNAISSIIVWKEGRIYELRDAYDQDVLTMENMRNIAYNIWGSEVNLENHAGLAQHSMDFIAYTYLFNYVWPYFPEAGPFDIQIENYYGSYNYFETGEKDISPTPRAYNDHVAVMMNSKYDLYFDNPLEETVAGALFQYDNGNRILLWKIGFDDTGRYVGRFYELQEAYDSGLLLTEDVMNIAYYHETGKTISYKFTPQGWEMMKSYRTWIN